MCVYVWMNTSIHVGQKKESDPAELKSQAFVSN